MQFDLTIGKQIKLDFQGIGIKCSDRGILELLHQNTKQLGLLTKGLDLTGHKGPDMTRAGFLESLEGEDRSESSCEIESTVSTDGHGMKPIPEERNQTTVLTMNEKVNHQPCVGLHPKRTAASFEISPLCRIQCEQTFDWNELVITLWRLKRLEEARIGFPAEQPSIAPVQ